MTDKQAGTQPKDAQSSTSKPTAVDKAKQARNDAAKVAKAAKAAHVTKTANTKKPSSGAKWGLFVAFIALITAAYVAYQNWQLGQQLTHMSQSQANQLDITENRAQTIATLETGLFNLQQALTIQNQTLAQHARDTNSAVQAALTQIAQAQNKNQESLPKWQLVEAEYLLRLANQRLAMEQNPAVIVPLLEGVDEIMRTSKQIGSYGVRQAIAADLIALGGAKSVDVAGIYANLAGLTILTDQLTYIISNAPVYSQPSPTEATSTQGQKDTTDTPLTWLQGLQMGSMAVLRSTWGELKDLIRVQQREQTDQILVTPETDKLLRMRIQLMFAQSQAALLRGQEQIYKGALQQAHSIIKDYYRATDPVAVNMANKITELQGITINATMPDISGSLRALQDLQTAIHQRGD